MIQISEPEESESLSKNIPIIHYRFNRKFDFLNCHTQLYISNSKLKIVINCNEEYSKEIKTYTNSFSLYDLQEISKYFKFFNKIEDVLEDLSTIFNQCNYEIEKSGHKLNIILHLDINEELLDIKLQLYIVKNMQDNDKNNKRVIYYNPRKTEETDAYRPTKNSNHNVGVKSMNDLNKILTDLKDRLTVLEVTQNTNTNTQPQTGSYMYRNERNKNIGYGNALNMGSKSLGGNYNENILLRMESIMKRITKLEETSQKKSQKIQELKEKLKAYEPTITSTSENESINDNNTFKYNNTNNYNYNYNNVNDFNNINQNQKYINLGSIRNVDTSTITSNNSYMNKELLEIKEEKLNNSFAKNKINKNKKRENNLSEEEFSEKIENNNIKKQKNKIKEKGKLKKRKNKSVDKLRKDNDEEDNEFINPQNKKASKIKSIDKDRNNKNNNKEEINTDIIKEKKKSNLKKSFSSVNVNNNDIDSQKLINNLEKNIKQNNIKNNSIIKSKKSIQFENNNNYNKKKSSLNKDNNDDYDINYINNNNEEVKNSLKENDYNNKINNINNIDTSEENNNNNLNNNNILKFSRSINDNIEKNNNNLKIKNQENKNNNSSSNENSNENNSDSSKEKEKKIAQFIEKNKELELEQEIEAKEEKKRRQKAFMDTSSQESLRVKQIHKSLTMAPKEDIKLYCKSKIIFTKKELKLLKDNINQDKNKYSVFFDVLYRASEDGDNVDIVKKIMEKQKRTLTLFQTEKGARFGIFVEKKLDTTILMTKYLAERAGTSFLVSLNNLEIYDIYKNYTSSENKLCFIKNKKKNRNGSSYAIFTPPKDFLGKICYMGDLTAFFNVDGNEDIIGEKEEYKLKEVEICKVAIEKRNNEVIKNEFIKSKTEVQKKSKENENKISYGREYSFKDKENSSEEDDGQGNNENNVKKQFNREDEEKISNKLKYDYYDWGIINGKNDKK